ncbi:multidrug effflux MFS transporter [Sphingobacterium corticibacter]|uniref:Major facilitator superfamily (MFS) profile domain-containing protein n=1 Tax=Sphingobacterium corticibacter TaxID=2171749 RepID=A0A2T8HN57_9SPHI|nr:multidrug effflux MFS transporter [Sphingobacterium corticibacter]PVH26878.1 hypothetical protein DC487_04595 [Sphingobacterium corticibacter]
MKLSYKEILIVIILSLLTSFIALSIDLYLPAFKSIAEDLHTDMGKVQVSLSVFIGGLAVGQLLWGTLSDRVGRKLPLIIAIIVYSMASILAITADSIEELWLYRFLQAFSGSAGMVLPRAVVTDYFDRGKTAKIFSLLALISGVAPIIAPSIGNLLLGGNGWHTIFFAMAVFGAVAVLLVIFFLPETHSPKQTTTTYTKKERSVLASYAHVFQNKQFVVYTLVGSLTFSALMVYISNSPFLIMEIGGFTGTEYSLIFGLNAIGMVGGNYSVGFLVNRFSTMTLVKSASLFQTIFAVLLAACMLAEIPLAIILVLLFFSLIMMGILLTATVDLALAPFHNDSGTASAVFGFFQLGLTFVLSGIIGLVQNNSVMPMALALLSCAVISFGATTVFKNMADNATTK